MGVFRSTQHKQSSDRYLEAALTHEKLLYLSLRFTLRLTCKALRTDASKLDSKKG
jgi:hypothetical protein